MMNYTATSNSIPSGRQGICPAGWHISSVAEWSQLTTALGGMPVAGGPLKESGTANRTTPNSGATNATGFTALPGGERFTGGVFSYYHTYGYFWSSTRSSGINGWYSYLYYNSDDVYRDYVEKVNGCSVRCLRD